MKFAQNNHPTRLFGTWEYVGWKIGKFITSIAFLLLVYSIVVYYAIINASASGWCTAIASTIAAAAAAAAASNSVHLQPDWRGS